MGAVILLIAAVGVVLFVLLVTVVVNVVRRSGAAAPMPPMAVPAALQTRVRVLLGEGKPVTAIKEVREATGLGLKEAKQIVDALRSGPLPEPGPYVPGGPGGPGSVAERARQIRDTGDFAGAVALVRAETGMAPLDAERFVATLG
ncbi:ribosomal protein L7/L12 [Actinoallomurus purpureus]|uniref:ribosomal protein L7/L12 n=1 Tax=Actinoallomurus purpureus TaxID=478114 RepID=UPI002093B2FF|nr:ribosomal protein L7/L12 [Actinoallomurus purpureus]MCO6008750.1 ribosomal protein L7/L12 [Actinoallomurus purpureus]